MGFLLGVKSEAVQVGELTITAMKVMREQYRKRMAKDKESMKINTYLHFH